MSNFTPNRNIKFRCAKSTWSCNSTEIKFSIALARAIDHRKHCLRRRRSHWDRRNLPDTPVKCVKKHLQMQLNHTSNDRPLSSSPSLREQLRSQRSDWVMDVRSCRYRHADLLRDKISSHVCPLRYILWFYWRRKASSAWRSQRPGVLCVSTVCLNILRARADQSRWRGFGIVPTSRIFCPRGVKHNSSADSTARAGFSQTNQSRRH